MRQRQPTLAVTAGALLLLAAVLSVGCVTGAPGQDPVVVNIESALKIGASEYDIAMTWAEAHPAVFTGHEAALARVNAIRAGIYQNAWNALFQGEQTYKATKSADYNKALLAFQDLVGEVTLLVLQVGGPDAHAQALAQGGK